MADILLSKDLAQGAEIPTSSLQQLNTNQPGNQSQVYPGTTSNQDNNKPSSSAHQHFGKKYQQTNNSQGYSRRNKQGKTNNQGNVGTQNNFLWDNYGANFPQGVLNAEQQGTNEENTTTEAILAETQQNQNALYTTYQANQFNPNSGNVYTDNNNNIHSQGQIAHFNSFIPQNDNNSYLGQNQQIYMQNDNNNTNNHGEQMSIGINKQGKFQKKTNKFKGNNQNINIHNQNNNIVYIPPNNNPSNNSQIAYRQQNQYQLGPAFMKNPKAFIDLKKTKMCSNFKLGNCLKGDMCSFAHSESELKQKPDLNKTKLCQEFESTGECKNPDCGFAHGVDELRHTDDFYKTSLCFNYSKDGTCEHGDKCRYAHGEAELKKRTEVNSTSDKFFHKKYNRNYIMQMQLNQQQQILLFQQQQQQQQELTQLQQPSQQSTSPSASSSQQVQQGQQQLQNNQQFFQVKQQQAFQVPQEQQNQSPQDEQQYPSVS